MLQRLLGVSARKSTNNRRAPPSSRAYAIGDVHGRLDLLRDLLSRIEQDNAERLPAKTYLILLGDLVDRGPDSRGVIDHFLSHPPSFARTIFLKGNHEEFFMKVLSGEDEVVADWLSYGGYECAESYGVSKGWALNASPSAIADRLRVAVPEAHKAFLDGMADSFRFGDYLFVHAGIRPGIPIEQQSAKDLRWIRDGFLEDSTDHGLIVVHGHTIVERPEEHSNRIALDTGAYRSGVLTAIRVEDSSRCFISVEATERPQAA